MSRQGKPEFFSTLAQSKLLSSALILFTLSIGIVIGTVVSSGVDAADDSNPVAPDATPLTVPDPVPVENQFSGIAKSVRPAVVNISVEQTRTQTSGGSDDQSMDDLFRRFFGLPGTPEGAPHNIPRQRPQGGVGSGIVVDAKGYIITNKHVVEGADRVRIRFTEDDELYDAQVIGTDEETDLAVIKVDAKGKKLTSARLGNSEAVNVGDWAIAIGSPFGYRETVTVGIISAAGREVQGGSRFSRPFQKFFQTDAAINPGNSGGPLVNIRGEVIGINTAIVSRTGAYEGLGFALPSNIAVNVYNQLIRLGRVARGSIGITFRSDQDAALLRTYGAENGVFVTEVKEGGPADEAGLKSEDVIVAISGEKIFEGDHLIEIVAATPVGDKIPVEIIRGGEKMTLNVEVADRAVLFREELGLAEEPRAVEEPESDVALGISVQNLAPSVKEKLDYSGDDGVLVTDVEPASFAEDIGLLPNDIIVAINRRPVASVNDVRDIRGALKPGDDVAFKVMRVGPGGWTPQYFAGVLPEEQGGKFD